MDVVICGDKERLPRPRDKDLLEEDLGHVERGDDSGHASKLEEQVEILTHCATAATRLLVWSTRVKANLRSR